MMAIGAVPAVLQFLGTFSSCLQGRRLSRQRMGKKPLELKWNRDKNFAHVVSAPGNGWWTNTTRKCVIISFIITNRVFIGITLSFLCDTMMKTNPLPIAKRCLTRFPFWLILQTPKLHPFEFYFRVLKLINRTCFLCRHSYFGQFARESERSHEWICLHSTFSGHWECKCCHFVFVFPVKMDLFLFVF